MIAATILAAGRSTRMGRPKALLKLRQSTFLQTILDAVEAAGIARRIVVLGSEPDKILSEHDFRGVTVVTNHEMEAGPIGSLRAAVRAVSDHPVDGLLVWPVDAPHVAVSTVEALIAAFQASDLPIAVPVIDGKRGHPVIFGRELFGEILDLGPGLGADAVVRADPLRVLPVEVRDLAVLDDVDTPAAYHALLRREDAVRGK